MVKSKTYLKIVEEHDYVRSVHMKGLYLISSLTAFILLKNLCMGDSL